MSRLLSYTQIQTLPASEIRRFQDQKFAAYARHVLAPNNAHYRELFDGIGGAAQITGIDDWQRHGLPLFRKREYRGAIDRYVLRPDDEVAGLEAYLAFCDATGPLSGNLRVGSGLVPDVFVNAGGPTPEEISAAARAEDPALRRRVADHLFAPAGAFLTGGTSGEPTPVYHSALDVALFRLGNTRMCLPPRAWLAERGERMICANLYPHAAHQAWWALAWGLEAAGDLSLGTSGGGVTPSERLVDLLAYFQVNFVVGMPGYLRNRMIPLMRDAVERGKTFPRRMVVGSGAEAFDDTVRTEILAGLTEVGVEEVVLIGEYGASELRFLVFSECPGGEGYHSSAPDLAAIRTVRMRSVDDWEFVPPGEEGVLVAFPFDGTGTSLVGFVLGDLAVIGDGPCPGCGSSTERIVSLRRDPSMEAQLDVMGLAESKVKGATVSLTDLREQLLQTDGVQEVQIVVERVDPADPASGDVLRIRACPRAPVQDRTAMVAALERSTRRLTEVRPVVEVIDADELFANTLKFKPILDTRAT